MVSFLYQMEEMGGIMTEDHTLQRKQDPEQIIRKWYRLLDFPEKYDHELNRSLQDIHIPETTCIESYDLQSEDGARNLLSFLYMCEKTDQLYTEKGISRDILISTLKDIRVLTDTYDDAGKPFYLGELDWLKLHLSGKLFKLGRLQFAFGNALCSSPLHGLKKGEPVLEIHIDNTRPLLPSECSESFLLAGEFFKNHFPEYRYRYYTCESWLLGSSLAPMLPENSNIMKFRHRFDLISEVPSDDILRYVFHWNTKRDRLPQETAGSSFAETVKKEILNGGRFYIGYGILSDPG